MGYIVVFFFFSYFILVYEVANRGVADYEVTDYEVVSLVDGRRDYEVVVFCFTIVIFFPLFCLFSTRVKNG